MQENTQLTSADVQQLLKKAEKLESTYEYDAAIAIYLQILPIFKEKKDWEQYVSTAIKLLDIYFDLKKLKEVKPILEEVQNIAKKELNISNVLLVEIELVWAEYYHYKESNYKKALDTAQQIVEKYLPILGHYHPFTLKVYRFLCDSHGQVSEKEVKLKFYNHLEEIFLLEPDKCREALATVYIYFGAYYLDKNTNTALSYLHKALKLVENEVQAGIASSDLVEIWRRIGITYYRQADFDLAIQYFQKTLFQSMYRKNEWDIAIDHMNIGNCYIEKEEIEKGLYYQKKAAQLFRDSVGEKHEQLTRPYCNIGIAYLIKKEYEKSIDYLEKALSIFKALNIKKARFLSLTYDVLGANYYEQKQVGKAKQYWQKGLAINIELFGETAENSILGLVDIGKCLFEEQKYKEAFQYHHRAVKASCVGFDVENIYVNPSITVAGSKRNLLEGLYTKKVAFYRYFKEASHDYQDLQMALFTGQVIDELIEDIRESRMDRSKMGLINDVAHMYEFIVKIAIVSAKIANENPALFKQSMEKLAEINKAYYPKESFAYAYTEKDCKELAFYFCEKSKGSNLLENLSSNKAKITANIPADLLTEEKTVQENLRAIKKQIQQAESALIVVETEIEKNQQVAELTLLQTQYLEKNQVYQKLLKQLQKNYPQYHEIKYQNELVQVADLQKRLGEQECVLNYFIDKENIFILTITKQQFEIHTQTKPADLEKNTTKLLKAINLFKYKKYVQTAYQLFKTLIAPILPLLQANNISDLIIIPHADLNYIPFESLLTHFDDTIPINNYQDLAYLIKSYNISYHYSANLLYHSLHKQTENIKTQTEGFIGFAPVYVDSLPNSAISSVNMLEQSVENVANSTRSVNIGDKSYQALLYSEEEVKAVQQLFEKKKVKAQTFVHEQATIAQFKAFIKDKKYIHIAAHGHENKQEADLTGIIFSPEEQENAEEAILYLADTYSLQLKADLVVLSSCKSGVGKLAAGEGMIAMNRGFLYAGAKNVVYTLFKVYDKASSEFTQYMFKEIIDNDKETTNYAKALRQAKLQMIAKENYTPKHWAGYVLIGK